MSDIDKLIKALKPAAGEGGLLGKAPKVPAKKKGSTKNGKRR